MYFASNFILKISLIRINSKNEKHRKKVHTSFLGINNIFRINKLSADTSRHLLLIRQGQNRYLSQSNWVDRERR